MTGLDVLRGILFDCLERVFLEPRLETTDFRLVFLLTFFDDCAFLGDFDDDIGRKPEGKEIIITISHIS